MRNPITQRSKNRNNMNFKELNLKGGFEIELKPHEDERGFFARVYDDKIFKERGLDKVWVQENISFSVTKGTVRGLHFQYPPYNEAKIISVLRGEVFFVAVDLRKGSPTFSKWENVILSEENKKMLYLTRGFALGMCTLTDNCLLHYKIDNYYSAENAESIKWNDPDLNIKWPIKEPTAISEKDKNAKSFKEFLETKGALEV